MNHTKYRSLVRKAFVVMSSLVLALGLGVASSSSALAKEDHHGDHHEDNHHEDNRDHHEGDRDEFVRIKGVDYEVRHNGEGPYIDVNGVRYFIQDDRVVVKGVTYSTTKEDRHEGDRHEGDRHHEDHKDHKD